MTDKAHNKSRMVAGAIGASLLLLGSPAMADDRDHRDNRGHQSWQDNRRDNDWRHDNRHDNRHEAQRRDARQDRRDEQRAYQHGVRDGRYVSGSRGWQTPVYVQPVRTYPARHYPGQVYAYPTSSRGWVRGRDYWYDNGRYQCRRQDGTTGAVVGAVAGGTLGNILAGQGDKTLGSIIGGTLGAIIGKEIEQGNARCR